MNGAARNLNGPSAFAAALDDAVVRLKGLIYRLQATLQMRLNLVPPAPELRLAGTPVIPTVRYRDVPAAIAWLCRAFGMKVHRVESDTNGRPCYAELTVGSGMLMVAPIEDTVFGRLLVQPDEIGGVETQVCYLCVANVRAHHARAKAAGAVVVIDPDHEANRGRGYSCRDPEGHVWNFGTYDPWEKRPRPSPSSQASPGWSLRRLQQGGAAVALLVLAAGLLFQVASEPSARASAAAPEAHAAPPAGALPMASIAATARPETAGVIDEDAADHDTEARTHALVAAERAAAEARAQLAEAHGAIEKARREAKQAARETAAARMQLGELERAKEAAERAAAEARAHLATAQQSAKRARAEAALERARRIAAGRAALRAARRTSVYLVRPRPRTWCYSLSTPHPPSGGAGRLDGFCRG